MKKSYSWATVMACLALASCAQPQRMLEVKQPGSTKVCEADRECVIEVLMSVVHGQCVYDLPDIVFVPRDIVNVRWELRPAPGVRQSFRFPAAKLPVAQKPGDKGPPISGPVPGQREAVYTIRRDAPKTPGITAYKMSVDFQDPATSGFSTCKDLDPVIINMP